jgi:hypothetical protein
MQGLSASQTPHTLAMTGGRTLGDFMQRRNTHGFLLSLVWISIQVLGCGGGGKSTPVTIGGSLPATGTVGAGYVGTLTASGGSGSYMWAVGGLPAGVMASGTTTAMLTVSGTPTTAGTSALTATVTDSKGLTATSTVSIVISAAAGQLAVTLPAGYPLTATLGTAYAAPAPNVSGGTPPYTFVITQSTVPGLAIDSTTGAVTGTPTQAGSFGTAIEVTDSASPANTALANFTIVVSASGAAVCAPRGNETALMASAPFAFLVKGFDITASPITIGGSFTPNGDGTIKASSADYNGFNTDHQQLSVNLATSSYSFGTDNRGCLSLSVSPAQAAVKTARKAGLSRQFNKRSARRESSPSVLAVPPATITFSFALGEQTGNGFQSGRVIEFDDAVTGGSITAGMMHVQSPSAFSLASLAPNYAFGVDGWDPLLNRLAIAGTFINTSGTLSGGVGDYNDQDLVPPVSGELDGGSGAINATIDASTGRGTGVISLPTGTGSALTFGFAFYVINGSDFYVISTDSPSDVVSSSGLLAGQALATKASFAPGSLSGSYLLAGLGFDPSAFEGGGGNVAEIANFQASADGAIAGGNFYVNDGGTFATNSISAGTYVTQASGRTTITATGSGAPVGYLAGPSSDENVIGFFVGTDPLTTSGAGYLQTSATANFSATFLNSAFAMGSDEDVDGFNGGLDGVFTFDGVSKFSAVVDTAFFGSAPAPGQTTTGTFTVNADGSGILTFAGGSASWAILTNGTQIFAIDKTGIDGNGIDPLLYIFTIEHQPD